MASVKADLGKRNLFRDLRRKLITEGKNVGDTISFVDTEVQVTLADLRPPFVEKKKKAKKPAIEDPHPKVSLECVSGGPNKGWAALLGTEMHIRESIDISLTDTDVSLINQLESMVLLDAFMELQCRALVLGRHLRTKLVKENPTVEMEKLQVEMSDLKGKVHKLVAEKERLENELLDITSNLNSWISRCLQAEEKERNVRCDLVAMSDAHAKEHHSWEKISRELMELQHYILVEHEQGFRKALRQPTLLFDIPASDERFDIGIDVYHKSLVSIDDIPDIEDTLEAEEDVHDKLKTPNGHPTPHIENVIDGMKN